jgi:hypothetical protein
VTLYQDRDTYEFVAVKFDPPENEAGKFANILKECHLLLNFSYQIQYLPKYFFHGTSGGRRFLVMEYLKQSLA